MLGESLLDYFEEPQRVASALKMKDLSLANPITVYVKKPDGSKVRLANKNHTSLEQSVRVFGGCIASAPCSGERTYFGMR